MNDKAKERPSSYTPASSNHTINCSVFRCVDGDTFMGLCRFRIVGFDAAELGTYEGKIAKGKLRSALAQQKVQLRFVAVDVFGRAVVEVIGFDFNTYQFTPSIL
jgi:endonuclease YncB( thermonuclease family)